MLRAAGSLRVPMPRAGYSRVRCGGRMVLEHAVGQNDADGIISSSHPANCRTLLNSRAGER